MLHGYYSDTQAEIRSKLWPPRPTSITWVTPIGRRVRCTSVSKTPPDRIAEECTLTDLAYVGEVDHISEIER